MMPGDQNVVAWIGGRRTDWSATVARKSSCDQETSDRTRKRPSAKTSFIRSHCGSFFAGESTSDSSTFPLICRIFLTACSGILLHAYHYVQIDDSISLRFSLEKYDFRPCRTIGKGAKIQAPLWSVKDPSQRRPVPLEIPVHAIGSRRMKCIWRAAGTNLRLSAAVRSVSGGRQGPT